LLEREGKGGGREERKEGGREGGRKGGREGGREGGGGQARTNAVSSSEGFLRRAHHGFLEGLVGDGALRGELGGEAVA